jgi:hypothetical protein
MKQKVKGQSKTIAMAWHLSIYECGVDWQTKVKQCGFRQL